MTPVEAFSAPADRDRFFALAARIFGVARETLTDATEYESIVGWDSVNHLRLVMETEQAFGVRYRLERIPFMRTLADFFTDDGGLRG